MNPTDLQSLHSLYEVLLENLPDVAVFVYDTDLCFTLVGGQAGAMGWAADELVGRRITELGLGDRGTYVAERMQRALEGEKVHLHITGSRVPDRVWDEEVVPMYASDGTIVGGILVTRDVTEAERLRAALASNEEILRSSLEALTEPFLRFRAVRDHDDGRIVDFEYVYCNPAALRLLDRPVDEVIGRRLLELYPSHRATGLFETSTRVVATGEPERVEFGVDGGGVVGTFEVALSPAGDGLIVTGREVGAAVREAEMRREADLRIRAALENMFDSVVVCEAVRDDSGTIVDFRYTYANARTLDAMGRRGGEIVGRLLSELYPATRTSERFDQYCNLVEHGGLLHLERVPYSSDPGGPVTAVFDIRATRLGDGFVVTYRDVTAQHNAERALRESEELFRTAVASMFDPFVILRAVRDDIGAIVDFEYVFANDAAAGFVDRAGVAGGRLLERFPSLRDSGLFDAYCDVVATGEALVWEAWTALLPGASEPSYFDTRAVRLDDGFAATWRDVTELERSRLRLERQATELARSNAELQDFAYVASHDMAEPLRTVAGFTELLQQLYGERLGDEGREFVRFIASGIARLQAMLDDLLTYSRVDTDNARFEPVDLSAVAAEAIAALRAKIDRTGADVVAGELPTVVGDPGQLARLVQNLVSNALSYVVPGAAPVVRIGAEPDSAGVRIVVADNGIGVPPEDRERIFQMFVRLRRLAGADGTGIGLAVCARIVGRHGGHIWVEDNPGGGSRFCFTLAAG